MNRRLEIQICSVDTDSDVACEKLKEEYLKGNYTQLRKVRTKEKIKRVVAVESESVVEVKIIEWKPEQIPASILISEYRNVCEEIAVEQQHSTVTPRLQNKLCRLEELLLQRLE